MIQQNLSSIMFDKCLKSNITDKNYDSFIALLHQGLEKDFQSKLP